MVLYLTKWLNNMDLQTQSLLDDVFYSLSDPTRRSILFHIARTTHVNAREAEHPLTVTEIYEPFKEKMSLPAISKHLKVLERSNLIKRHKKGREYLFQLQPEPLKKAVNYISFYTKFWRGIYLF